RAPPPGHLTSRASPPARPGDPTSLLLTRRRTVAVSPHQVRPYARDSVRRDMDLILHGGLAFRLVIDGRHSATVADTVYRSLSFRDMVQLRTELNRAPEPAPATRPAVRPRVTTPPPPPAHPPKSRATPRSRTRTRRPA